ncbi:rifin [Plasmodium falciparum RAJ116]|uniref:Rifin n=1 Tax=Plasmodium falciparum RAJ116 TaxID=580058 RepID=A0A0L0CRX9_PLAFA|nr:rifin [Plasmodium falciparum RAJ116]
MVGFPKKNPSITPHTPKIPTTRLLCECELYAPANYDSDPQMKKVMQQFEDRTTQRFHEYDDRMQKKRKQCKDKCDKEIQTIILKDKLEKQMAEQFSTLQTDIQNDAIPTCVCEKSLADKMEKGCLRCGYGLGSVAPMVGLIGSVAVHVWKPVALKAAIKAALEANTAKITIAANAAGDAAGKEAIIGALQNYFHINILNGKPFQSFFYSTPYTEVATIASAINTQMNDSCGLTSTGNLAFCGLREKLGVIAQAGKSKVEQIDAITGVVSEFVDEAKLSANAKVVDVTAAETAIIKEAQEKAIETASYNWYTTIGYSILAILIIVLIMVIIYLILRYRRKKKIKKKLQYIKLLEE